jgi:hypothetical protein
MSRKRALLYFGGLSVAAVLLFLAWPRQTNVNHRERSAPEAPRSRVGSGGGETALGGLPQTASSVATVPVAGAVRDAGDDTPLPGVTVTFRAARAELSAVTRSGGAYDLDLPPGIFEVSLAAADHVATLPRSVVRIEEGEAVKGLDFALYRAATVAGRVVDPAGRPLRGAEVRVHRARGGGNFERSSASVKADLDGRFSLKVPPAEVVLRADAGSSGTALSPRLYATSGTHIVGVEIVVGGGAGLSGRVVAPGATPVAGGEVLVKDELGLRHVPCDKEGRFAATGLPPGWKQLQATAPGYAPSQLTQIELRRGPALPLTLQVGVAKGVGGKVVTEDGLGVPRARVTVHAGGPAGRLAQLFPPRTAETDDGGSFLVADLPNLPLVVTAQGPGNGTASRAGVPPGSYDLLLKLERTGAIAGQVTDGLSGKAIQDFTVTVTGQTGAGNPHAGRLALRFVSAAGRFVLEDLMPGTYELTFTAPRYGPVTKAGLAVVAGYTAQSSVVLDAGGSISGVVVDDRGAGIPGAAVRVDSGWRGGAAVTDAGGKFLAHDIARGVRSVSVTHSAYDTRIVGGVSVFPNQTAAVRVELAQRKGAQPGTRLTGIGLVLTNDKGALTVLRALPGSPAGIAGLRAGDVVLAIDNASASAMSFADGVEALRGVAGTPVRLRLRRGEQTFDVDIIRGEVNVPPEK